MEKQVSFNLTKNIVHQTYSKKDYDRGQIDSTLYLYCYGRITQVQWIRVLWDLNEFKSKEMIVHIDSLHNTKII